MNDHGTISADEDLQRKEQGYRLLVENTKDVIWSTDLDLKRMYVSPSVQLLTGLTPEEAAARAFSTC